MASEWTTIRLADCGEWLSGGTPSKNRPEFWKGSIPWVSPKDMNTYFIRDTEDHITLEAAGRGSRLVPKDTILFVVRSMRLANEFQVAITERTVAFNQDLKAIRCYEYVDPRFLFCSLRAYSNVILRLVDEASHGTKRLKTEAIGSLTIPMPVSRDEQRAIAEAVGILDDKIELNRRMNGTLEAIARAIFQSWFVYFDPVHAKARGEQPYGMDAEMAALFPDAFEESELGPIPAGWQIGRLDDLLVLQRGFDLPTSQRTNGPYPVIAASGPSGTHIEYRVKGPGVTTGRSGVIGNVFFVHDDFWPLNTSLWVREFRVARPVYAYHLLQELDLATYNAGSAVPTLNRNHIHSLPVLMPPTDLVREFDDLIMPMFVMLKENERQSCTFAALRDTLLPKLISGQLRVSDAEEIV